MPLHVDAGDLNVAYLEAGDPAGPPVVLLHGFPYDVVRESKCGTRVAKIGG